jgi:uncharacterized phage infection (PIP) family protein YhgE
MLHNPNLTPLQQAIEHREREKIRRFDSINSTIDKAFTLHCRKEYNLLKTCMPSKIYKGKEYFDEKFEKLKEKVVDDLETAKQELSESSKITHHPNLAGSIDQDQFIPFKEFYEAEQILADK